MGNEFDKSGGLTQNHIDFVVDGKLKKSLSDEDFANFVKSSSILGIYDEYFIENEISEICWIRDSDVFDLEELRYWDSYFEYEFFEDTVLSENRLEEVSKGETPTTEEYRSFLRKWIPHSFENFNWSNFPIASLHRLTHSDGRTCVALIAMTEGGQGGWEFDEVFEGLFGTKDDAIGHLKENGIIDSYDETELEVFLNRFPS